MWTSEVDFIEVVGIVLLEVSTDGHISGICICGLRCEVGDWGVIQSWAERHNEMCLHPTKELLR